MNIATSQLKEEALREMVRSQFDEWCTRNELQIPENPSKLFNNEELTASHKDYVWSVMGC